MHLSWCVQLIEIPSDCSRQKGGLGHTQAQALAQSEPEKETADSREN